ADGPAPAVLPGVPHVRAAAVPVAGVGAGPAAGPAAPVPVPLLHAAVVAASGAVVSSPPRSSRFSCPPRMRAPAGVSGGTASHEDEYHPGRCAPTTGAARRFCFTRGAEFWNSCRTPTGPGPAAEVH